MLAQFLGFTVLEAICVRTFHLSNQGQTSTSARVKFSPSTQGPTIALSKASRVCAAFSSMEALFSATFSQVRREWKIPGTFPANSFRKCLSFALSKGDSGMSCVPVWKVSARYQLVMSLSVITVPSCQMVGTFPVEVGSWKRAFLQTSVNYGDLSCRLTSLVWKGMFFSRRTMLVLWAQGQILADQMMMSLLIFIYLGWVEDAFIGVLVGKLHKNQVS